MNHAMVLQGVEGAVCPGCMYCFWALSSGCTVAILKRQPAHFDEPWRQRTRKLLPKVVFEQGNYNIHYMFTCGIIVQAKLHPEGVRFTVEK